MGLDFFGNAIICLLLGQKNGETLLNAVRETFYSQGTMSICC